LLLSNPLTIDYVRLLMWLWRAAGVSPVMFCVLANRDVPPESPSRPMVCTQRASRWNARLRPLLPGRREQRLVSFG